MFQKMFSERSSLSVSEYIRLAVGLLYIAFGVWIVTGDVGFPNVEKKYQTIMGFVLVLYGTFRIVHIQYRHSVQGHRLGPEADVHDDR